MNKILAVLFIFIINGTMAAQNYLPLHTGNKWQYIYTIYDADGPSYDLTSEWVEFDSLIDNKVYYKTSEFSDLIKYDTAENILFFRWNDQDHANINFNVPPDSVYQIYDEWHNYITVTAVGGEDSIFNRNRVYHGYLYIPASWGYTIEYTDSIGITYDRSADNYLDRNRNLIEAIIYDSSGNRINYTYHRKPHFEIEPLGLIDTSVFNLEFQVLHSYTRILPSGSPPWHIGLDFIDSVRMFSFYSKDDSIIYNPVLIPDHESVPVNNIFSIHKILDTTLLKDGFIFNYRFMAKDKGIIPEYAYSPDSGYYQCIWNGPSSLNEYSIEISKYLLFQNYPNPFNPTTNIKYQIPESSTVKLTVYDMLGREIKLLVNEEKVAGIYEVEFYGAELPSGVYFYRIEAIPIGGQAGEYSDTKKLLLLK